MEPGTKKIQVPEEIIEIWQRIVDTVSIFLSVPGVMINRLDTPDIEVIRSNTGPGNPFPSGTRMPQEGLYCTEVALRHRKLQISDTGSDVKWAESPTAKARIISYMGVPIEWPDGDVFGTLCAVDTHKNMWDEKAVNLLQTLKDAIESHLELVMSGEDMTAKGLELEAALNEVLTLHGFSPLVGSGKKKSG